MGTVCDTPALGLCYIRGWCTAHAKGATEMYVVSPPQYKILKIANCPSKMRQNSSIKIMLAKKQSD